MGVTTHRPKRIRDGGGRQKIEITLPGGRYQLSLDAGGTDLVDRRLGCDIGHDVPPLAVRTLVATGDAWFPNQRDYRSVIEDLSTDGSAAPAERAVVAEYLRSRRIPEARMDAVRQVIEDSRLRHVIDVDEIDINELPSVPDELIGE